MLLKFVGEFTKLGVIFIKLIAISYYFADVSMKLRRSSISFFLEVLLDGLQVHRFLYYF